jgi:hypothetical protein
MGIDFPLALGLLGALLLIASGLSGWLHGTVAPCGPRLSGLWD